MWNKTWDLRVSSLFDSFTKQAQTVISSHVFITPKIFQYKPYPYQINVWSLVIILYYMRTLKVPFLGRSLEEITK
jgi:serine/threonine protein kinase